MHELNLIVKLGEREREREIERDAERPKETERDKEILVKIV